MKHQNFVKVEPLFEQSKQTIKEFHIGLEKLEEEKNHLVNEMESVTDAMAEKISTVESLQLVERIQMNLEIKSLTDKSEVIKCNRQVKMNIFC